MMHRPAALTAFVRFALVVLAAAAVAVTPSCCIRRPVIDAACAIDGATARDAWRCHRDVVERVVRGRPFSLREYREAAGFLERLTGIPAGSRVTRQGPVPDRRALRDAAARWDEWIERHGDDLAVAS